MGSNLWSYRRRHVITDDVIAKYYPAAPAYRGDNNNNFDAKWNTSGFMFAWWHFVGVFLW